MVKVLDLKMESEIIQEVKPLVIKLDDLSLTLEPKVDGSFKPGSLKPTWPT